MRFGIGLALLAGLTVPSAGWAQAARKKAPGREIEIQEVTVTAQRREEAIQETPISVSALSCPIRRVPSSPVRIQNAAP